MWDGDLLARTAPLSFGRYLASLASLGLEAAACHSAQHLNQLADESALRGNEWLYQPTEHFPVLQSDALYVQHATRAQVELPFALFRQCAPSGSRASSPAHGQSTMPRTKKRTHSERQAESERAEEHSGLMALSAAGEVSAADADSNQPPVDDSATVSMSWKSYHETDSPISPSSPPRFSDSTVRRNWRIAVDHSVYTEAQRPWNWMGPLLGKGRETGWCKRKHQVMVRLLLEHGRDYEAVTEALTAKTGYKFHVDHVRNRVKELLAAWEKQGLPLPQSMSRDGLIEYTLKGRKKTTWAMQRDREEQLKEQLVSVPPATMPILTHNWLPVTFEFLGVQQTARVSLHCLTLWWRDDFKHLPLVQAFYNAFQHEPVFQPYADALARCSDPHFLTLTNIIPPLPLPDKRNAAWVSAFPFHPSLLVLKGSGQAMVTVAALREGGVVQVKVIEHVNRQMEQDEEKKREALENAKKSEQKEGESDDDGGEAERSAWAVNGEAEGTGVPEGEMSEEEEEKQLTMPANRKRRRMIVDDQAAERSPSPRPPPLFLAALSRLHPARSAPIAAAVAHGPFSPPPPPPPARAVASASAHAPLAAAPHVSAGASLERPKVRLGMSLGSLPRVKIEPVRASHTSSATSNTATSAAVTTTTAAIAAAAAPPAHISQQPAQTPTRNGEQGESKFGRTVQPVLNVAGEAAGAESELVQLQKLREREREQERERERELQREVGRQAERQREREREVQREVEREAERRRERERGRMRAIEQESRQQLEAGAAAVGERDTREKDRLRALAQKERERERERERARERSLELRSEYDSRNGSRDRHEERSRERDSGRERNNSHSLSSSRAYEGHSAARGFSPLAHRATHRFSSREANRRQRSRSRSRSRGRSRERRDRARDGERDGRDSRTAQRHSPRRDSGGVDTDARKRELDERIQRLKEERERLEARAKSNSEDNRERERRERERARVRYSESSSNSADQPRRSPPKGMSR